MPTYTKNLKLQKPLQEEFYDIEVINANSEKIDTAIGNKVDKIDGKGLSTNDYTNEEKEKLATLQSYNDSGLRLELDKKADKTYTDAHRTYTLTHSKSGKIHTLSDLPTGQGIYQCQFIATSDYTEGDTFTGYTAKPQGEEMVLPNKAFVKGDIVSVLVDTVNKKICFDVSAKVSNTISNYKYSKSGTTHNLTGRGNNIQFIPTADFVSGDTIKVNGVSVTPVDNLGEILDEPFKANIIQNVTLQGNKLVFKTGGGGTLKPKIYIQTAQPPISQAKEGEFWVQGSGFNINKIVADTKQPTSMPEDTLFVLTAFKENSYKLINTKNYIIGTWVQYAQLWYNGSWKDYATYIYDGTQWINISMQNDRLFYAMGGTYAGSLAGIYEIDTNTMSVIKKVNSTSHYAMGGTHNHLYGFTENNFNEIDMLTYSVVKSIAKPSNSYDCGGTKDELFTIQSYSSPSIIKWSPQTLTIIGSGNISGAKQQSFDGIDGMENDLYIGYEMEYSSRNYYPAVAKISKDTYTVITSQRLQTTDSSRDTGFSVGGNRDKIYSAYRDYRNENKKAEILRLDPNTLGIISRNEIQEFGRIIGHIGGTK